MWKKRILALMLCLCMVMPGNVPSVLAEDSVVEETAIPECQCNTEESVIYNHADDCLLKSYCKNLVDAATDVDALYLEYQKLPENGQQCVLDYLLEKNYETSPYDGWYDELSKKLNGGGEETVIPENPFGEDVPSLYDVVGGKAVVAYSEVFPEGATLSLTAADAGTQLKNFGVLEENINAYNIAFAYNIKILQADSTEWQPEESEVAVQIPVNAAVGTSIGILHTHEGKTTYLDTVTVQEDGTIVFVTDGFSEFVGFTVDFHYEGVDYSIAGMSSILLSALFENMGIDEDASLATSVLFSDSTLVEVTKQENDWLLTSLEAFDTEETLVITFEDNHVVVIDVTDEQYMGKPGSYHIYRLFGDRSDFYIEYNSTSKAGGSSKIYYYYYNQAQNTELDDDCGTHYWALTSGDGMAQATTFYSTNNALWFYIYKTERVYMSNESRRAFQIGKSGLLKAELYFTSYSTAISWTKTSGATIDPNSLCSIAVESRVSTGTESRNVEVYYNGVKAGEAINVLFPNKNDYNDGYDQRNALVVSQKNTSKYRANTYTLTYEDSSDTQNVAYTYDSNTKTYKLYFYDYAYKLNYNLNGGSGSIAATTIDANSSMSYNVPVTTEQPTRNGYRFLGWADSASATTAQYLPGKTVTITGTQSSIGSTITAQKTIYAVWQKIPSVTIHHYLSGTTTKVAGDTVVDLPYNQTVTVANYAKAITGHKYVSCSPASFNVGTTDSGNTAIIYYEQDIANYKVNVYKQIMVGNYDVTSHTLSGIISSTATVSSFAYASDGYTFNSGKSTTSGTIAADGSLVLNLYYDLINYTITYDGLTGATVSGNPSSYTVVTESFALNNPTKTGYTFAGWTGNDLSSASKTVTITKGSIGNRSYTATWDINKYTVTGTIASGRGSVSRLTQTVEYGKTGQEIIFTPNTGYIISAITVDGQSVTVEDSSKYTHTPTNVQKSYSVVVTMSPVEYTITYKDGSNVISTVNYTIEDNITLFAAPTKAGYTFNGWKPDSAVGSWMESIYSAGQNVGTGQYGDITLVAQWTQTEHTATAVAGTGISETKGGDKTYHYNVSVTFTATVKDGYNFDGWYSGNDKLSSEASYTFTMPDGSVSYTAKATPITYTITYAGLDGADNADNPTSYTVESNDIILKEPTKTGYTFIGWSGTGLTGESNKDVTIPKCSTGNRTYTAHWQINSYTVTGIIDRGTVTGGEATDVKPYTQTVNYGDTGEKMTFTPAAGYEISSITIDDAAQTVSDKERFEYTPTNVVKDIEIVVTTVPKKYTITWNLKYPDDTVKTYIAQEDVAFGSIITAPEVFITNYNFSNDWQVIGPASGIVPTTMPNNNLVVQGSVTFNGGSLTITKSGMEAGKSTEFNIVGKDGAASGIDVTVTIEAKADGSGDITIHYLPAGTYTVTEKDWSWEYEPSSGTSASNEVSINNGHTAEKPAQVSFSNVKKTIYNWLAGEFRVNNKFGCKLDSGTN